MSGEATSDAAFERVDARRLAFSRTTKAFLAVALLFPLVPLLGQVLGGPSGAPLAVLAWLASFVGFAIYGASKKAFGLVPKDAHVEASSRGLEIDGKLVPRSKLDNAAIVRDPNLDGYRVMLGSKRSMGRKLLLLTRDEQTARGIVAKLGLDASRSTATWSVLGGLLYSRAAAFGTFAPIPLAILLLLIGAFTSSAAVALSAIPVFLSMYVLLFTKMTAVVGTDGVLVKWLGFSRFCRFEDVREVVSLSTGARLVKTDGTHFDVQVANQNQASRDPYGVVAAEVQALQNRIREAMSVRAASPNATVASDPYLRGERSVSEWLESLRRAFEPGPTLRSASHTEDAAWRVVLDHSASEDARVGAAAAIAVNGDETSREKLRVVAETVADTRVRVALEAAATGDEQALVKAMESVGAQKKG